MTLLPPNTFEFFSQFTVGGTGIKLDWPFSGGLFAGGFYSGFGVILSIFFSFLLVAWVVIAIMAGYRIIMGMGEAKAYEEGYAKIKSIWIGISYFVIFFMIINLAGVFFGFGSVYSWAVNLSQCGPESPAPSRFYFQDDVQTRMSDLADANFKQADIYCCSTPDGVGELMVVIKGGHPSTSGTCELNQTIDL